MQRWGCDKNSTILRMQWMHRVTLNWQQGFSGQLRAIIGFHCVSTAHLSACCVTGLVADHITTHIPLRHPGTLRKAVERQHAHLFLLLYCPAVSTPSSCSIKYLPSFVNNTTQTFIKSNYTLSLSFAKLNILNPVYVWGKQKIVPYLSSS